MSQIRFSPLIISGIFIAVFFALALYLRIAFSYQHVFAGDIIKFAGFDAWYHVRLVENLLQHFPQRIVFDPYTFYPYGLNVYWPPFFDWLLASIILLVGLGSPTQHTIEVVSAYFPAILGALTVIPVYFIGKTLFNRWTGLLACGLIALLPGEFLHRSILGFTDHHAAEVLFSTISLLFIILAIKCSKQRQLSFNDITSRNWASIGRPIIYALLAGIFLGIYFLTWVGGLFLLLLVFIYFAVQFIIEHLREQSTEYLGIIGTIYLLTATLINLSSLSQSAYYHIYIASMTVAVPAPLILAGLSRLMTNRKIKAVYYPISLVALGLAALAALYIVNPTLLRLMIERFGIFTPAGTALTITEVQPILILDGKFTISAIWDNFTTGFFLSLISLGIVIYLVIKQDSPDKNLLLVWSIIILGATLGQRRFSYYLSVNVALLTGYLSWLIVRFIGFNRSTSKPVEVSKKVKKGKPKPKSDASSFRYVPAVVKIAIGLLVIFFLSFYPNIKPSIATASGASIVSDAWYKSLLWLKDNTPDPFGNPAFYYELYEPPPSGESYKYPESAYGVMAWWDYGHWITRIAHRIPISNPHQYGAGEAAQFFTAQDETAANKIVDILGVRYVVVDEATATTKFHGGIITFAGRRTEEFFELYFQQQDGKLKGDYFFYPAYYRSLAVRLYNFDGNQINSQTPTVISYEEKVFPEGDPYKKITDMKSFSTYDEAEAYISSRKSGNHRIVGSSPFVSPVPLEKLESYTLIYSSEASVQHPGVEKMPAIKIFEYNK